MRPSFGYFDVSVPLSRSPHARTALPLLISKSVTRRSFGIGLFCAVYVGRPLAQQRPYRIVSTAPSITEALFALGLGGQVVGVSQYCDFPPEVQKLPKVGTYVKPDAEAIARLAPDLVILQRTASDLTNRLTALGIAFIEVPHGTLNDVFTGIRLIAKAAGIPENAPTLIGQIQSSLNSIQTKARALPSPHVIVIANRRQGTLTDLVAIGPDNYVNQILEIAGGTNVLAKPGLPQYPHISLEVVLRENPNVILDLTGTQKTEAQRKADSAATLSLWQQNTELAAVRTGHVYVGTSNALLVPGPRTAEATQILFDYIHGIGSPS
jgi:iron complex transport system substrate-binding protein